MATKPKQWLRGALRFVGILSALGVFGLGWSRRLEAQITIRQIIGKADPGASAQRYPEIQEAIDCCSRHEYPAALAYLKAASKKHANLPPTELMITNLLIADLRPVTVMKAELEACIKNNPDDPEAYLMLADEAFTEGKTDDAERQFSKAEQLAPQLATNEFRRNDCRIRAAAGLAAVAERREQWDVAKKYLDIWLSLQPHNFAAHDRLGRVLFHLDPSPTKEEGATQAYKQFRAAVADDETAISADLALALMYQEAKLHDKAREWIARSVKRLPEDRKAKLTDLLAAARWGVDTDELKQAREYADLALMADPKSSEARFLKGIAARLLKDLGTAEKCFEEVHHDLPANFAASNQLAQVLAEQNDKQKKQTALELAQINNRLHGSWKSTPEARESAATLGWVLYQLDRKYEAAQAFQTIENRGAASSDALYFIARLESDQPEHAAQAIELLKSALEKKQFFHRQDALDLEVELIQKLHVSERKPKPGSPSAGK